MQDYIWGDGGDRETGEAEPKEGAVLEQIARYLKNRDYFEAELVLKLRQKDYSEEEIERGLAYYKELGLIRDGDLAYRYALTRLGAEGPNKVLARLAAKGVEREVAREGLARALEELELDQEARVEALLKESLSAMGMELSELDYRAKQKIARRLYNKGYSTDIILRVMKSSDL